MRRHRLRRRRGHAFGQFNTTVYRGRELRVRYANRLFHVDVMKSGHVDTTVSGTDRLHTVNRAKRVVDVMKGY